MTTARPPSPPLVRPAGGPVNVLDQSIAELDPDIAQVLDRELARQQRTLEMIASENFVPSAVLQAQGSVLTNKYAEGYPGRRYYGGCEEVDVAEQIAIDRAKELFGAEHANVQSHSGASANAAVMHALARPGDKLMGLSLAHGGHLTHGMKINFSGRLYDIVAYETDPETDRKSTRLNSSHVAISYAVFCLKKKKRKINLPLYKYINT